MKTAEQLVTALNQLRSRVGDRVLGPDDTGWDEARRPWNLSVDQHPAAVATPESAQDVVAVVDVARQHGLRVAPQGTGHSASPRASLEGSVLLDMSRMNAVEIDPERRLARLGAGAQWRHVVGPAAEHGLAGLSGSAPDVCVTGYAIGGGASWMIRRYGLAANSIRGAEVVTADGREVRADSGSEPDLFWALRGGGGSFGVVTALELELFPIRELYGGVLFWPQERAAEVLEAWREWAAGVPDEMTSLGRLLNVPPLEELPEALRGRSFVVVEAAWLGDEADGRRLLEHGILYAPDYVINSAAPYAVIGAGELGYAPERLAVSVQGVAEALQLIFRRARAEGLPTAEVADRIAEERVAAAAHLRAMATGTGAVPRT